MILEELTLKDFGLFAGEQTFVLKPQTRGGQHRPIVLFGGLNGGGKTTLFDAIQLVLYGPRAKCSKRASLSYDDFLKQSVHHGVPLSQGASLSLSFQYSDDGEEHLYEVRRSWRAAEGRVREEVRVFKDALHDTWLSDNWPQLVEDIIPLDISQLFFFDAEKIRVLAEDDTSGPALGTAIKSLLGLDIVERLILDSSVLQTRLAKRVGSTEEQTQLELLEGQVEEARKKLDTLLQRRASLQNDLDRAENEVRIAEEEFAGAGGKHWEARQQSSHRLGQLTTEIQQAQSQLIALAGGELPLVLVQELFGQVQRQDQEERQAVEQDVIRRLLVERDQQLIKTLESAHTPAHILQKVEKHLAADREARSPASDRSRRLNLSEDARSQLARLTTGKLAEAQEQAEELLAKLDKLTEERDGVERTLAAAPSDEDIARIAERLKTGTQSAAVLREQLKQLNEEIRLQRQETDSADRRLQALLQKDIEKRFEREDLGKLVQLAGRSRELMEVFLNRAMERKIDRLSDLITESFRFLLRKKTLVERVMIDPANFAITLYDNHGRPIPKQRLSEGEKQLFAIALLWGLARAAVRPLPAVIDTPMARLDASHRLNLVERYFPNASHQVIILSTDTEVDRSYYEMLLPSVARAYHLNYDEQAKKTVGEEGYFWKERATA